MIGFIVKGGATTTWIGGSAKLDPSVEIDWAVGEGKGSVSYSKRWTGGDRAASFAPPGTAAEFERYVGPALRYAKSYNIPFPSADFSWGAASDGQVSPTETLDGAYCLPEKWVMDLNWLLGPADGKSPSFPTDSPAFANNSPFRYFVQEAPKFHRDMYFRNLRPDATGVDPKWPRDQAPADAGPQPGTETLPTKPPQDPTAALEAEAEAISAAFAKISPAPAGVPARLLRRLLKAVDAFLGASLLLLLLVSLTACGTLAPPALQTPAGSGSNFRRVVAGLFTQASMSDLQFEGVSGGNRDIALDLAGQRSPELAAALQFAIAARLIEPVGPRLLEMTLKGETTPRLLLCRPQLAAQCALLQTTTPIRAYVVPVGFGNYTLWVIHRVVAL